MKNNKINKNYIFMTLSAFFWSGAFIAGKYNSNSISPFMLTFLRFLFASLIMVVIVINTEKKENWLLKGKDLIPPAAGGLIGIVGYHLLFFYALKYSTATTVSLLAAVNPLISSILAVIFVKESLTKKQIGIFILALFGVVMILMDGDINVLLTMSFNKGDLLMLLAVICWCIYMIIVKKYQGTCSTVVFSTYNFIFCVIYLLPYILINEISYIQNISFTGWASILYMAVFSTVIGYVIQNKSIREIGVSKTSLFINLVPVFSMILAVLMLNEKISTVKIISAILIICAVYANSKIKTKKKVA